MQGYQRCLQNGKLSCPTITHQILLHQEDHEIAILKWADDKEKSYSSVSIAFSEFINPFNFFVSGEGDH
jgi:hypothetical protein